MGWKDWAHFIVLIVFAEGFKWMFGAPSNSTGSTTTVSIAAMVVIVGAIRKPQP